MPPHREAPRALWGELGRGRQDHASRAYNRTVSKEAAPGGQLHARPRISSGIQRPPRARFARWRQLLESLPNVGVISPVGGKRPSIREAGLVRRVSSPAPPPGVKANPGRLDLCPRLESGYRPVTP